MTTSLEQLLKQKEKLEKQIRQVKAKEQAKKRKEETHRKILAGAVVLAHAEHDAGFKTVLMRLLDEQLKKSHDRELFAFQTLAILSSTVAPTEPKTSPIESNNPPQCKASEYPKPENGHEEKEMLNKLFNS